MNMQLIIQDVDLICALLIMTYMDTVTHLIKMFDFLEKELFRSDGTLRSFESKEMCYAKMKKEL